MKSFIKCVDVDFESSRIEDFYDIQLNVKNCKDLVASFADYCTTETLEGENAYQAEGLGLQKARKGVIFTELPPVLHLQLKRFEYDMERDMMVKINDRHEFPLDLDLGPYLEAAPATPQLYHLHGVLVHSGHLNGGHYFAMIRPTEQNKW
jgi:ubiquitin carboxyl-terminal hydrolase 7